MPFETISSSRLKPVPAKSAIELRVAVLEMMSAWRAILR